jgi:hypothetical protein
LGEVNQIHRAAGTKSSVRIRPKLDAQIVCPAQLLGRIACALIVGVSGQGNGS